MEISIKESQQLKALAILMMLFLHLFNRDYHGLFEPLIFIGSVPLSYYLSLFSDACVPIFCFVSGYGLYYKYQKNQLAYISSNLTRIKKLYINYWIVLILFAVILGFAFQKEGLPGSLLTFILNFTAILTTYNGAWWFFLTYILLVASSKFLFKHLNQTPVILVVGSVIFYLVSFISRTYRPNIFGIDLLYWIQHQVSLYGTSLFPFLIGAYALKEKWNSKISFIFSSFRYKSGTSILGIILLIIVHAIIPNFIIAPFLAIPFIFFFLQIKQPRILKRILDFLAPHAVNMWLIHMFFYVTYFKDFIYGAKYVPIIFAVLILCSVLSSFIVNRIYNFAVSKILL